MTLRALFSVWLYFDTWLYFYELSTSLVKQVKQKCFLFASILLTFLDDSADLTLHMIR